MRALIAIVTASVLAGCSVASFAPGMVNDEWVDYRSWYKVTPEPVTGDPTGSLDGVHEGEDAYRVVYVNSVGEAVNRGEEDFPYPEGSILVKETYGSLEAAENDRGAALTVMKKLPEGSSQGTGDWEYINGAMGIGLMRGAEDTRWGDFCGDCHARAFGTDYNFMNSQTMSETPLGEADS